jgi:hypothetical protein
MDTLLIIIGFDDRCHPGFGRDCGCRSHLRRMGERGVCVKVRLTGLADNTQSPAIPGQDG